MLGTINRSVFMIMIVFCFLLSISVYADCSQCKISEVCAIDFATGDTRCVQQGGGMPNPEPTPPTPVPTPNPAPTNESSSDRNSNDKLLLFLGLCILMILFIIIFKKMVERAAKHFNKQ